MNNDTNASAVRVDRDSIIIRTSIIGILANVLLAVFKAAIGIFSHSIAITLDAVNNLSDALSSVITIAGSKLAGKPADKKHPFGYGRVEYLSASIISIIVLFAGVTSLKESITAIIHPTKPEYATVGLVILAVAVAVKLLLGRYVKSQGEKANSQSLIASGTDALFDSIISASTLVAALIFLTTGISLEAWLGAVISLVIIKAGIEMLRETISELLGQRVDADFSKAIKKTVAGVDGVRGAYDLTLNNYGPDHYSGSVHIEIPDTLTADEIDTITRNVQETVLAEHDVVITAVGIYSTNTKDPAITEAYEKVGEIVHRYEHIKNYHGFYINFEDKRIRFDVLIGFSAGDLHAVHSRVLQDVQQAYPDYDVRIGLDIDISD